MSVMLNPHTCNKIIASAVSPVRWAADEGLEQLPIFVSEAVARQRGVVLLGKVWHHARQQLLLEASYVGSSCCSISAVTAAAAVAALDYQWSRLGLLPAEDSVVQQHHREHSSGDKQHPVGSAAMPLL